MTLLNKGGNTIRLGNDKRPIFNEVKKSYGGGRRPLYLHKNIVSKDELLSNNYI
ncbi:hypothetical protein [Clostridium kluyveri]|uniref:hypothetical protein n=1 Tax=Clostridium kluyveri TaxID=1534 RepID=UPI0012DE79D2|nr:hypothetical protein [Clostridium kluyveri]